MNFSLTITADSREELLALLGTPVAHAQVTDTPTVTPAPVANDTDDENDAPDANAPSLDKRGLPWDERIHASSKALNADGTWRYRRNTPKETIEAVESELAPANDPLAIPAMLDRRETPAPAAIPVPTGAPCAPAPAATAVTYEQIIAKLTGLLSAGTMKPADMPDFWAKIGVAGAAELVGNQAALDKANIELALK